jgi:phosphoglycolate phosphatase
MIAALNTLRIEERLAPLAYDEVRPSVSHGAGRLVKLGFPAADPETSLVLQQRYLAIYRGSVGVHTRLFAGMDIVLASLATRGLVSGIVTNKPGWLTAPLLEQLGLTGLFACVVSGDSVAERKPHAMPMLHAARLAGVSPDECVYLGDAERDIQAAHAAGMPGLVATYGYLQADEDWRAWGGDGFIREPAELLPWLDRVERA